MSEKTAVRSRGYRAFHSFLCAVLTLILMCMLITSAAVRYHVYKKSNLSHSIGTLNLGTTVIPFSDLTVAEYVKQNFATDESITADDVARLINEGMDIPEYLQQKMNDYFAMLRGETDTVIQFEMAEINDMFAQSEAFAAESESIIFEPTDQLILEAQLSEPIANVNQMLMSCYGSPALRAFARFRLSYIHMAILLVLLILVLLRWMKVHTNSGSSRIRAVRAFSLTLLIPAAISVVIYCVRLLMSAFIKDNVQTLTKLELEIFDPVFDYNLIAFAVGVLMFILAFALKKSQNARLTRAAKKDDAALPVQEPEVPQTTHCVYCKRTLKSGANFCTYCGRTQSEDNTAS